MIGIWFPRKLSEEQSRKGMGYVLCVKHERSVHEDSNVNEY